MPDRHDIPPAPPVRFRSKTLTAALAFLFGSLGAHRFYLYGFRDIFAWLHVVATAVGLLGLTLLASCKLASGAGWACSVVGYVTLLAAFLGAIVYGLRPDAKWDAQFNAHTNRRSDSGWTVVLIVIAALFVGASVLMGGLAIGVQTYFEAQIGHSGLN